MQHHAGHHSNTKRGNEPRRCAPWCGCQRCSNEQYRHEGHHHRQHHRAERECHGHHQQQRRNKLRTTTTSRTHRSFAQRICLIAGQAGDSPRKIQNPRRQCPQDDCIASTVAGSQNANGKRRINDSAKHPHSCRAKHATQPPRTNRPNDKRPHYEQRQQPGPRTKPQHANCRHHTQVRWRRTRGAKPAGCPANKVRPHQINNTRLFTSQRNELPDVAHPVDYQSTAADEHHQYCSKTHKCYHARGRCNRAPDCRNF